jgi:hypothetical protein
MAKDSDRLVGKDALDLGYEFNYGTIKPLYVLPVATAFGKRQLLAEADSDPRDEDNGNSGFDST